MIGRRLSHYDIIEEISRGGMGVVYRAVDANLGREVALKVLPEELVHDARRRERLVQEARAASALEHPHIAVIHDVGDADGVTFIAMELIRGEKLSGVLSRGPLAQPRALALATEIAEGLARAHEKGIIHRDLKPANVIVTEDGHAKIIDFGLAKVVEPSQHDAATVSVHGPRTDAGLVLGTAAYMSPEQARGHRIDPRSDVFALGVTLYEMVTGRPAFQGQSSLDTMQAVLTQPVPPLPAAPGGSGETTAELQRIIAKATAKDPEDRFQGMKDLVVDLRAARRRLESGGSSAAATPVSGVAAVPAGRPPAMWIAGIAAAAALAAALIWWWPGRQAATAPSSSDKASLAVLYFENNTGDSSLDWMRTGLTDMMVTDLSQSTDFEVLGTDRLVEILQELRRADDRVISADVVEEIANRAAVDNVLVGSYVKAGDTIRINARLQEARTGRIITAERVEGSGEASVLSLVDELTRRFTSKMSELTGGRAGSLLPRPGEEPSEADLDRGLTQITTSSIEAYRYYAEGLHFHERSLSSQAVPLLEKAIEIDPTFAMAHAKLAVVYNNLVEFDKRDEHAKRALELTDRLTPRERYYIEGFYYTNRPDTFARGLAAYQQLLKLYPDHQASRHNLGLDYLLLERYPDAIEQYEELLRRGTSGATSYENLADALTRVGNVSRARQVADSFVQRHPDNAAGLRVLAMTLGAEYRFDDARATFEKAEALDPLDFVAKIGRRAIALVQERWEEAAAIDQQLGRSKSPFQQFLGNLGAALRFAARGQGQASLNYWTRAIRVDGLAQSIQNFARGRLALPLMREGKATAVVSLLEPILDQVKGKDEEFEVLQLLATAQAAVGRESDSVRTLATLEARAKVLPSEKELRRVHWAKGEIALLRNDTATAVNELTRAVDMLSTRGPVMGPPTNHCDIWLSAALANIRSGRDSEAARLLERIQSGYERAFALDVWARSFYLLGQIYERRGDTAKAREQYAKFVQLWGDGDLERQWVAEARKKMN